MLLRIFQAWLWKRVLRQFPVGLALLFAGGLSWYALHSVFHLFKNYLLINTGLLAKYLSCFFTISSILACTFIGTERNGNGGSTKVIVNVPPQQQQPMMVQMAPAPGFYAHSQEPTVIQTQPGASQYFAPQQQPQIHQFQPEAPPMYSPAK